MSDQITINVTPDPAFDLNVEEQDQNVYINPISLNEGVINHSVTHISGGSDELPHNSLGGLQGGVSGQFYHLTSDEYVNLVTGQIVRPNETGVFVTKSETGAFYAASNPSGFITGVDLSNYATLSYTTGISGSLQSQISDLNNQTGNYALKSQTGNFITQSQTGQFYSSNNPSGYTPTGYVSGVSGNLQDQITVLNNQTGSFYPRNNPSGYITGVDLSFSGNYYTKTESESRYVNTTGVETILGDKTFHDKVYINSLYVTGLETIVNTTNTNVASNYLILNLTGGAVDGGIFFVTGSGLTGINDSGAIIGFDHSDKFKFGIGTRASDLSVLDTIASVEEMTGISGSLQTQISTLNSATGSYVLTSESGQFYPSSNPSGFINEVGDYLPLAGGTIDGNLSVTNGIFTASNGANLYGDINIDSDVVTWTCSTTTLNSSNTTINGSSLYVNVATVDIVSLSINLAAENTVTVGGYDLNINSETVNFNSVAYTYSAGSAAAHRDALGAGAVGDELFTSETQEDAQTALGILPMSVSEFATGSGNIPLPTGAKFVSLTIIGGGGGGGSGSRTAVNIGGTGGLGGCGGSWISLGPIPVTQFTWPLQYTVGTGGTGGTAVTTDSTAGNGGIAGTSTIIFNNSSAILVANGGRSGNGGVIAASTGNLLALNNICGLINAGVLGGSVGNQAASSTVNQGAFNFTNTYFPTSGGTAGGISTGNIILLGSAGAPMGNASLYQVLGGDAGTSISPTGKTGNTAIAVRAGTGGGGATATTGTFAGNRGGNGGLYGGGGGGGSASRNGRASGAGGNGAGGLVQVTFYY